MTYLQLVNGQPEKYSVGKLKRDNPEVSFPEVVPPETLAAYDVYPYGVPPRPQYDSLTQTCTEGAFEQNAAGAWLLPWVVDTLPENDAASNVRSQRDALLSETDWIVIKALETGQPTPHDWDVYRQELRDIPQQQGFPYNVVWPTQP
jgi:hypothetical protein